MWQAVAEGVCTVRYQPPDIDMVSVSSCSSKNIPSAHFDHYLLRGGVLRDYWVEVTKEVSG